jgi:hypothetical protein
MKKLLLCSAVAGLSLFYSCSKEETESLNHPSSETLKVNLESFPTSDEESTLSVIRPEVMAYESLLNQDIELGVMILDQISEVSPSVTTGIVTSVWNTSVTYNGKDYDVSVVGQELEDGTLSWQINLKAGINQNYEYATGISDKDFTSVKWTINEIAENGSPVLTSTMTLFSGGVKDVSYEMLAGDYSGYTINKGYKSASDYDAFFNVTTSSSVENTVEWSRTDGTGTVYAPSWLGNEERFCWDANGRNTTCD